MKVLNTCLASINVYKTWKKKVRGEEKYKQFNNFVQDAFNNPFKFVKYLLYSKPQEYKDDCDLVPISKVHILAY